MYIIITKLHIFIYNVYHNNKNTYTAPQKENKHVGHC